MQSILFRADGSSSLGMGHIMRCLALAEEFRARGIGSVFLTRWSGEQAKNVIDEHGHDVRNLPKDASFEEEIRHVRRFADEEKAYLIVTDICHERLLRRRTLLNSYHDRFSEERFTVCLAGGYAVDIPAPVIVNPYVGAEAPKESTRDERVFLIGPDYFIFRNELIEASRVSRSIPETGRRILVTAGGGENHGMISKLVKALCDVPLRSLEVCIVLGNAADPQRAEEIEKQMKDLEGSYTLLEQTSEMAQLMLWADFAIIGDGLTKYEAAVTGTPSLMMSRPDSREKLNHAFSRTGATRFLGSWTEAEVESISDDIYHMLQNSSLRRTMSEQGKSLVDGQGRKRVLESIPDKVLK